MIYADSEIENWLLYLQDLRKARNDIAHFKDILLIPHHNSIIYYGTANDPLNGCLSGIFDFAISEGLYDLNRISYLERYISNRETQQKALTEKEKVLILALRGAIRKFRKTQEMRFYVQIKAIFKVYLAWLDRCIYKTERRIKNLRKQLAKSGVRTDLRQRIRGIIRFLFKNLDDEHSTNNETIKSPRFYCFNCLMVFANGNSIYRRYYKGY